MAISKVMVEPGQTHHHDGKGQTTVVRVMEVYGQPTITTMIAGNQQKFSLVGPGTVITTTSGSPDDYVIVSADENSRALLHIIYDNINNN